jgi:catechol 2,3-dioxygenase-like lactoylglutathione lyase family enzyme
LRPKALDHVGLIVTDMDRSLRFYQALGLELLRRSERGTGSSAVLKVGAQEINVFCDPDSADRSGPQRIDHFCLMMESAAIDDVVCRSCMPAATIWMLPGSSARRRC